MDPNLVKDIFDTIRLLDAAGSRSMPSVLGPLQAGHYVQVGLGFGFYVPEKDFQELQDLANRTGRIQFLGVTRQGAPLYGSREAIAAHPNSAGSIAWIVPQRDPIWCYTCDRPKSDCACAENGGTY